MDEEERGTRRKEGEGGKSKEEQGATRRKERRGGRLDEEEGGWKSDEESKKMKKFLKNEKKKMWLEDASLTPAVLFWKSRHSTLWSITLYFITALTKNISIFSTLSAPSTFSNALMIFIEKTAPFWRLKKTGGRGGPQRQILRGPTAAVCGPGGNKYFLGKYLNGYETYLRQYGLIQ